MTSEGGEVTMNFQIQFHGPFHVGTGRAGNGLDRELDRECLLPASSLKGLLRAEAQHRLELPRELVDEVFGAPGIPSPWAWSDAEVATDGLVEPHARIRIKPGSAGTVEQGMLVLGEHVFAKSADFTVTRIGDCADEARDELVLEAAARSVSGLGGNRRRGEGWVSIRRTDREWNDARATQLHALMGGDS